MDLYNKAKVESEWLDPTTNTQRTGRLVDNMCALFMMVNTADWIRGEVADSSLFQKAQIDKPTENKYLDLHKKVDLD